MLEHYIYYSCSVRLVKAGGGEVMEVSPPYCNLSGMTHILSDAKHASDKQIGYQDMANKGVPVLEPLYLSEFLTADTRPELDRFLIEEFKPFWESRKRNRITTDTPTSANKKSKSMFGNVL